MSGVLGIVACGVVLSYYGKPRVSSPVLPSLMDFWKTLQFFADTTIFFLSGIATVVDVFDVVLRCSVLSCCSCRC